MRNACQKSSPKASFAERDEKLGRLAVDCRPIPAFVTERPLSVQKAPLHSSPRGDGHSQGQPFSFQAPDARHVRVFLETGAR